MRILVADDDRLPRRILEKALTVWGYEVIEAEDGERALQTLLAPDAPKLAVLDWVMPGLDGPEVCRRVRAVPTSQPPFLILLTSRVNKEDVVAGLQAGANDYLTKPFDPGELQARVQVGRNYVELQQALAARMRELEEALAEVKQLRGLLPICSYCKKIRDDQNYWQQVDHYFSHHGDLRFSHGICPDCWQKEVVPQLKQLGIEPPKTS
jgi:DNA-binding response OmpR family regulator